MCNDIIVHGTLGVHLLPALFGITQRQFHPLGEVGTLTLTFIPRTDSTWIFYSLNLDRPRITSFRFPWPWSHATIEM